MLMPVSGSQARAKVSGNSVARMSQLFLASVGGDMHAWLATDPGEVPDCYAATFNVGSYGMVLALAQKRVPGQINNDLSRQLYLAMRGGDPVAPMALIDLGEEQP